MKRLPICKKLIILLLILVSTNASAATSKNGLSLDFAIESKEVKQPSDLKIRVTFTNHSRKEIQLSTFYTTSSNLKFRKPDGETIPILPISVPLPDDGKTDRVILDAGKSVTFNYSGAPLSSLKPGKYQAKFGYYGGDRNYGDWEGSIESGWVNFEVTGDSRLSD